MNQQDAMKDALLFRDLKSKEGVPDPPFKTDWHELAMKRMLRHAAENGHDQLAWTNGEQQAARYDLSRHVSKLEWHPVLSGDGKLWALDHEGNIVMQQQMEPSQLLTTSAKMRRKSYSPPRSNTARRGGVSGAALAELI